jgi:hypothetical protein
VLAHGRDDDERVETDRQDLFGERRSMLVIVSGIAAAFALISLIAFFFLSGDAEDVRTRHAIGEVTGFFRHPKSTNPQIIVTWGNNTGMVNRLDMWQVGQKCRVEYRIGKSGRVYLDDIEPFVASGRVGKADVRR